MKLLRISIFAVVSHCTFAATASAQTTFTWNNAGTDWTTNANWTPSSGFPGQAGGNTADVAQFNVLGTTATLTVNNPVLNSALPTAFGQLRFSNTASGSGWSLTGTGSMTVGSSTATGITTRGIGTYSINLGNGTATSLAISGPNTLAGGSMNIGSSSTLVLTGNTVATTGRFALRGGTLVLDNSAGNPTGQRLTTSGTINLNGGGSTIEFRGAAGGTSFTGLTGQLGASGAGDNFVRTVQNGAGALSVSFDSLARVNTAGVVYFANAGTGFVGDAGSPTITFTTAPTSTGGIISTSGTNPIGFALVTNSAGAGRWANYTTGVVAGATTGYTGNVTVAPAANTGVLFAPTAPGAYTYGIPSNPQVQSVTLEPTVAGTSLDTGAGFNTFNVLLSGANGVSLSGTAIFSGALAGTRNLVVLNPGTTLTSSASLNIGANTPTVIGGGGFLVLTGAGNVIGTPNGSPTLTLGGGTLRGPAAGLVFSGAGTNGVTLQLRGGVLEADVTAASATFNLALGTAANQVNWTALPGDTAGTNTGGGGFSAFSTTPGNTYTVNIGGAGATLNWNDAAQLFVTDGYALKFGSSQSNATLIWQNPINLGGNATAGVYSAREINVTKGAGTAADRTRMTGAISGTNLNTDLIKTGNGVLELNGNNTYRGNTIVNGGTLLVTGQLGANGAGNGTGSVFVHSGGTLGGTGTIFQEGTNFVRIASGGTFQGGDGTGAGTLTITGTNPAAALSLGATATLAVKIVSAGTAGVGPSTGGSSNSLTNPTNHSFVSSNVGIAADDTTQLRFTIDGTGVAFQLGQTYSYKVAQFTIGQDLTGVNIMNTAQFTFIGFSANNISVTGGANGQVYLNFTPVPEPASVLGIAAGVMGLGVVVRRRYHAARGVAPVNTAG